MCVYLYENWGGYYYEVYNCLFYLLCFVFIKVSFIILDLNKRLNCYYFINVNYNWNLIDEIILVFIMW